LSGVKALIQVEELRRKERLTGFFAQTKEVRTAHVLVLILILVLVLVLVLTWCTWFKTLYWLTLL
jgi:hypothetical protein